MRSQVPYLDAAILIARHQFTLVWVHHGVIDGRAITKVTRQDRVPPRSDIEGLYQLPSACRCFAFALPCVPNLEMTIFTGGKHPTALAMEPGSSDIASVLTKYDKGVFVGAVDIIETYRMIS